VLNPVLQLASVAVYSLHKSSTRKVHYSTACPNADLLQTKYAIAGRDLYATSVRLCVRWRLLAVLALTFALLWHMQHIEQTVTQTFGGNVSRSPLSGAYHIIENSFSHRSQLSMLSAMADWLAICLSYVEEVSFLEEVSS